MSKESYLITFKTFSIDAIYQQYPQFQFPADTMSWNLYTVYIKEQLQSCASADIQILSTVMSKCQL